MSSQDTLKKYGIRFGTWRSDPDDPNVYYVLQEAPEEFGYVGNTVTQEYVSIDSIIEAVTSVITGTRPGFKSHFRTVVVVFDSVSTKFYDPDSDFPHPYDDPDNPGLVLPTQEYLDILIEFKKYKESQSKWQSSWLRQVLRRITFGWSK